MIVLAIDTAASLCAACVWDSRAGTERGRAVRDLGKGHAEHLMDVIEEALARAGASYDDLDAVAVSVGPGSFTGIRVGVAAARGLALALEIPAIGVTVLEALAREARQARPGRAVLVALDGGRGEIHAALTDGEGREIAPPQAIDAAAALALAAAHGAVVTGTAADMMDGCEVVAKPATADIATFARCAVGRRAADAPPVPLYLRSADARVQVGFAVARRDAP